MKDNNIKTGARIRSLRENQKLSREKLAEMAGISTQFLADIETGKKGMTVNTLIKICTALHVSSDCIVFGCENTSTVTIDPMISSLSEEKQKEIVEILQKIIQLI